MPTINGTANNDVLTGTSDDDVLNGFGGNDALSGGEGNDILDGGAGLDTLLGEGGDDVLRIANAPVNGEVYNGGTGSDTLEITTGAGTPMTNPFGFSNVNVNLRQLSISSIEELKFASTTSTGLWLTLDLSQTEFVTQVRGGAGYDRLTVAVTPAGTYTTPTFTKVDWTETTNVWDTGDIIRLFVMGPGNYTLNASANHTGVEHLIGGAGNDTLIGTDGVEILSGGDGINILSAGGGDDLLQASIVFNGNQFNTFAGSVFDGGAGFDYLSFSGFIDFRGTVTGIEAIDLSKTSSNLNSEVTLGGDVLAALPSNLSLRGAGTLSIELNPGQDFNGSAWIHEAGSAVGVEVFGKAGNNSYVGTSGNDRFSGGFGTATMTGGLGTDEFEAGDGQHVVTDFTVGIDKVDVRDLNITSFAQVQPLLTQVGNDVVLGRMFNGVMQTMTLKNVNLADLGASSFAFQSGNDGDTRVGTENDDHLIGAFGDDTLQGLGGNDLLYAGGGADTLQGGSDDDHLTGGTGDDSIDGGTGTDTASYAEATNSVTVNLASGVASGADGNDTLTGVENVTGSAFNDVLIGDANANLLDGGAGNDVMTGGAGNDVYVVQPGDTVNEDPNGGIDEMRVSTDFGLLNNVENLTALGSGNMFLGGNELANVITGNAGDNFMVGNAGHDQLHGGAGYDQAGFALPASTPGTLRYVDGPNGTYLVQLVQADGSFENIFEVTIQGSGTATVVGLGSQAHLGTDTATGVEALSFFIDVYPAPHQPGQFLTLNSAYFAPPIQNNFAHVNGSLAPDVIDLAALYPQAGPEVNLNATGGGGDDTILGSSGGNYLDGEAGHDVIDGRGGYDTAAFRIPGTVAGSLVRVDNPDGTLSIRLVQADGSFENIFKVTFGATGSATVQALGSFAHLGTDTVTNVENLRFVAETWPEPAGPGRDLNLSLYINRIGNSVHGSEAGDTIDLANFTGVTYATGEGGNDTLIGTAMGEAFRGDAGNDVIVGGGGIDTADFMIPRGTTGTLRVVEGEAGRATVLLVQPDGSSEIVFEVVSTASGSATITGMNRMAHLGTDTVSEVEQLSFFIDTWPQPATPGQRVNVAIDTIQYGGPGTHVNGTIRDDVIDLAAFGNADGASGGNGNDTITGSMADEFITGGRGNDTIDGGGGNSRAMFNLPVDYAGTLALVRNADGSYSVWRVEGGTNVEQLFLITQSSGTITVTGLNSAAHLGTDTLTNINQLGFLPEGPYNESRSLWVNVGITPNGNNPYGGIFVDTADFSGRNAAVNFFGDNGDDVVTGSAHADTLNGAGDNDTISAGLGNDQVFGGGGNDTLRGEGGNDFVRGDAGSDTIDGGDGDDTLIGGLNSGFLPQPGDGADLLRGGNGNDVIRGGDGDDTLEGGAGHDNLRGDAGSDVLDGGEGVDFVSYAFAALGQGATIDFRGVDLQNGTFADPLGGTDTLRGNELLGVFGTAFDDVIYGTELAASVPNTFANQLSGNAGNDVIHGASHSDTLSGNDGNDTLYGKGGADFLRGDAGNDTIDGGEGADGLRGDAGSDVLTGGLGQDEFSGTLAQWHSDRITDLAHGESLFVEGVHLTAAQVQLGTNASGGSELRIDGDNNGTFETLIALNEISGQVSTETGVSTTPNGPLNYTTIKINALPTVAAPTIDPLPALVSTDAVTLTGTATPGLVISLYDGSVLVGQATAGANSVWSIPVDGLAEGAHQFTAIASDASGNNSAPSAAIATSVDTIAPPIPTANSPAETLSDNTPTVSGTAEAGATIRVFQGATVIGEGTAGADGSWSIELAVGLADGSHALSVVARDAAGNSSQPVPLALSIDTLPPSAPTISALPALIGTDSLTVSGTAEPGSLVRLFDGTQLVTEITAGEDGSWSVPVDGLADGPHSLTARIADAAGNVASSNTVSVRVDTEAPDSPIVESDTATTDATPEIGGVGEAGSIITITKDGVVIGSTVVGTDGTWTEQLDALADGSHEISVTATDAAGNASIPALFTLTVSGTTPFAPTISTQGGLSSSATLVLAGTAPAGMTVEIFDGATLVTTAVANDQGLWTAEVTSGEGSHAFTAVAIDGDGDRSPASPPVTFVVDTIPPASPDVTSGDLFNTAAVTLAGTAEAGSLVTIRKGDVVLGTATANAQGKWSFATTADQLTEGANGLTATARDPAGNSSEPAAFTVTVDTIAPTVPTIAEPGTGGFIDPDKVTLTGTAEPGAAVRVFDGGTIVGETLAEGDGSWSLIVSDLAEGSHVFTAVAIDEAGNSSPTSAPRAVMADSLPPVVTLTSAVLRADTGTSATDNVSNTGGITLTGTAEPGSVLTFAGGANGTTPLAGSLVVGPSGSWSFVTTLPEGQHRIVVTATDAGGNSASTPLPASTIVIDRTAPSVTLNASLVSDTGTAGDNISRDGRVNLSGTGEPGTSVSVFNAASGTSVLIGTATVGVDGSWSLATVTLGTGTHQLVARSADLAGNVGSSDPSAAITVDTQTAITMTQTLASDTGASSTDGVTRNGSVTLAGTAEAGATVAIRDGNTVLGTVAVGSTGSWSFTTSLADGTRQLTATATDRAGNTASATGSTIVVDRLAPTAPTLSIAADTPIVGGATRDQTLSLSGTAEANSRVLIFDNGVQIGTATAGNNGQWNFTSAALANGAHSLTARAEDLAGNQSPSTTPSLITIDTVAPPAPMIGSISTDTGASSTDRVTADNTLVVQGTAEPGTTISLYAGTELLGTATAAANGTWTMSLSKAMADGVHVLTATASDRVGNVSPASATFTVTVDTRAPTNTAITSAQTDTGATPSVANGGTTRDSSIKLTGTAEALVMVQLFAGTVLIGSTQADASGNWSFDYVAPSDGQQSFTAQAVDLAGNTHMSRAYAVTVDTSPPVPVITGAVSSRSSTAISGTADAGTLIQVYEGDVLLGTATATRSGTWKINTTQPLSDAGTHTLTATGTDGAGNVGSSAGFTLMGTSRADTLLGGSGNDVLIGYGGNDRLDGGSGGNDRLTGGAGNDIFAFGGAFGTDTVTDYQDGIDKLDLDASVTFASLVINAVDADGDGIVDDVSIGVGSSTILLLNVAPTGVTADDFLF